ncbi:MAG: hypothetical protein O3B76_01415 [Proteobacteria bacterium]|nr:hypothetical protein [Pseudomonadota bacterium]MDA1022269.1 hypothetical protein [Pseudomonadota bacterium]
MARLTTNKTSFTSGEISPDLLGRGDLRAYENGAAKLRNIFINPTGGLTRRHGLRYIDTARGDGRLVAFEFNTEQVYLLVFTDLFADAYRDGVKVASFATPWTQAQIGQIVWVQSADTLLVVNPDVAPKKITRTSDSSWTVSDWTFVEKDGRIYQPHHKFADDGVTLTASAATGSITLTASADVFVAAHVGARFRFENKEVEITAFTSATVVSASVKESLAATAATKDWEEQSFSVVRGWPASLNFHQDRMVIGGSRDLPNQLWLSKSADLFNFDLGTGLDDEAIEFAILSDQVNAIRAVFSGRHLQVFTSGAEWMVSGDPLTPANLQLRRQTRIGSPTDRTVPPRDVDGATLFTPRSGAELREFLFADVEQAYQSADLATLAKHLVDSTVDQDFDTANRLFFMAMGNGNLATVTIFRAEQVTAWSLQETQGAFRSVAMVGNTVYFLVSRTGGVFLEVLEKGMNVDSGLSGTNATPKSTWAGLDHLEGQIVTVLADGAQQTDKTVSGGAISLDEPATSVEIGLSYAHTIEPLPPSIQTAQGGSQGGRIRPVAITFRLQDTAVLRLDTGRGFTNIPFKGFGSSVLDQPPQPFSGDKTVRALGWRKDGTEPLWRIEQSTPLPFTLLSVTTEISING